MQYNNIRFSKTTAVFGPAYSAVNWPEVEHSSRRSCELVSRIWVKSLASTQRLLANDLQANHNSIFFFYAKHATKINCIRFPASKNQI
jgi:hypothetical protein